MEEFINEGDREGGDDAGEERASEQAEDDEAAPPRRAQGIDEYVDADVDAGSHAVGGADFRHPDEHVDAQFLRPRHVEPEQEVLNARDIQAGGVAVKDGDEDHQRGRTP